MKYGSDLDVLVNGAIEVIRGAGTVGEMKGALALGIALGKDLINVALAAAGVPAAAERVLGRSGNASVEQPQGRHVAVEAAVAVEGHLELEEEYLVTAGEAL